MTIGFSRAFMALFSACHCAFCSIGGHGGLLVCSVIETSLPDPGGSLTDWKRFFLGYLIQPGLTRPSALPGRSGAGPWMGTNVGSLPTEVPLGPAATVAGAAAVAAVFGAEAGVGAAGAPGAHPASMCSAALAMPRAAVLRRNNRRLTGRTSGAALICSPPNQTRPESVPPHSALVSSRDLRARG